MIDGEGRWGRRSIWLALVTAAVLALAACGGGSDAGDDAETEPAAAETAAASEAAATGATSEAASDEPITLTVWSWINDLERGYGRAIAEIETQFKAAHPNVTIEHEQIPYDQYFTKLRTALAAGEGPDVFWGFNDRTYWQGVRPLADLVTPEQREDVLFIDSTETFDPGLHGMPWTSFAYFWLWNKELVAQAGLDPDFPPTTFDELLDACGTLQEAGITPVAGGFKDGYYAQWLVQYGFADQLLTPEELASLSTNWDWQNPALQQGLEYLVQMQNAGCFSDAADSKVLDDAITDFQAGDAAMTYLCCQDPTQFEDALGAENVGIFLMPRVPDSVYDEQFMDVGVAGYWSIAADTESCSAAWDYISFYVGPTGQELAWTEGSVLPNSRSLSVTTDSPNNQALLDWLSIPSNHTGAGYPIGPSQESQQVADRLWSQVLAGRISVEDLFAQAQQVQEKAPPFEIEEVSEPAPCE